MSLDNNRVLNGFGPRRLYKYRCRCSIHLFKIFLHSRTACRILSIDMYSCQRFRREPLIILSWSGRHDERLGYALTTRLQLEKEKTKIKT
jgi:hypothetical protein